jgi:hypothetical protein
MLKTLTIAASGDPPACDLSLHEYKRLICHHPRRDEIIELPNQFLIDTAAIRNGSNSLKTNESDPF